MALGNNEGIITQDAHDLNETVVQSFPHMERHASDMKVANSSSSDVDSEKKGGLPTVGYVEAGDDAGLQLIDENGHEKVLETAQDFVSAVPHVRLHST